MNKQEVIDKQALIDELMKIPGVGSNSDALKTIKRFPSYEPQKVKVPEFVVEWFKENKHNLNFAIYELCEAGKVPVDLYEGLTDFERWFYLNHDIDTLIRMLDGYEVEEEPKYFVELKTLGRSYFLIQNLTMFGEIHTQLNEARENPYAKKWKSTFTKKEIKSIDERYWAFAVPVEQVEVAE